MSLVGGYPSQNYHNGGHIGATAHDYYSHYHQGTGTTGRYMDPSPGAGGPPTPEGTPYFQGWMLNHHSHQAASPHPAELPPGMGHHPGDNGAGTHPGAYMGIPGQEYGAMPMFSMLNGSGAIISRGMPNKKIKNNSNKKERRRTLSINSAFSNLRGCIPNVPSDTKLSKIKTLRLATSYIAYLMDVLNKDDPLLVEGGFKAEITKKIESREEKRKREAEEILKASSVCKDKKGKGRTGWPQQVWASELKQE